MVYYNENGQFAASWLRELIKAGHIAPGDVDDRSIIDVRPKDLVGYRQCHFFAGIGVWSYALRQAGWPDDREVWTGSCPCQPFSAAGKGEGYADERHLWPHWNRLIGECGPAVLFGEQVDAAIRTGWLDDVCLSLESLGYAVGAVSFPACSVGAPHIRQRLYFVADAEQRAAERHGHQMGGAAEGMQGTPRQQRLRPDAWDGIATSDVGDTEQPGPQGRRRSGDVELHGGTQSHGSIGRAGPLNGFWRDAEWIACRDGKSRAAKPGIFPLVAGYPGQRVGILRGAGNAINAEAAKEFILAAKDMI